MTYCYAGVLFFLGILASCSVDLSTPETTSPDDIPVLVMEDFVQTTVQNGRDLYSVQGKRAENYNAKQEIRLKDFTFQEYDGAGQVVTRGKAEQATVHTGNNDATIQGTLEAKSSKQGVALTIVGGAAGGVEWKNKDKLMSTVDGSSVQILKDDGSRITAEGMVLNLKTNELTLDKAVTGLWKTDAKTTDAAPAEPVLP